jgi:hypothetical protein
MFKRNNSVWIIIISAVAVCLVIIGLINFNLKSKTSINNNSLTDKEISNDSIGGVVQFDNKNYIFSKEFNENFDNSHISVNNLSITFTNVYFVHGTMNGKEKDIVSVHLTMYNYSDSSMYIYPNKSCMANKNGSKVNASIINSAKIGGEIKPNQFKDGDIVFPMTADVFSGQTSFMFTMTASTDKNGKKAGEDIVFNIKYSLPIPIKADGNLGYK